MKLANFARLEWVDIGLAANLNRLLVGEFHADPGTGWRYMQAQYMLPVTDVEGEAFQSLRQAGVQPQDIAAGFPTIACHRL